MYEYIFVWYNIHPYIIHTIYNIHTYYYLPLSIAEISFNDEREVEKTTKNISSLIFKKVSIFCSKLLSLSLSLSFSLSFSLSCFSSHFLRLQGGDIESIAVQRRTTIWQNSKRNLPIVFEVVRSTFCDIILCYHICLASDESIHRFLAETLDRHRLWASLRWRKHYMTLVKLEIIAVTRFFPCYLIRSSSRNSICITRCEWCTSLMTWISC